MKTTRLSTILMLLFPCKNIFIDAICKSSGANHFVNKQIYEEIRRKDDIHDIQCKSIKLRQVQ